MSEGLPAGGQTRRRRRTRAGITALNLIAPGLGLLRLGRWRAGAAFLLAPFALLAVVAFGAGHLPITGYGHAVFALVALLCTSAALYVVPMVLTWRASSVHAPVRGWSRWYGLAIIAVAMTALLQFAQPLIHHFYKPFYAPSASMAPTIGKGDKFVVDMRWRGPLVRGAIVIFAGPDGARVSRIVALPGDRIAMRGGVPVLNDRAVPQSARGRTTVVEQDGARPAAVAVERLPGEASVHRVLDTGPSPFDDVPEAAVPPGRFFVLGDNRDGAADSRVPPELSGAGMVPAAAIVGRPLYIHWSADRARIGTRLDR